MFLPSRHFPELSGVTLTRQGVCFHGFAMNGLNGPVTNNTAPTATAANDAAVAQTNLVTELDQRAPM
jgi:hypothetical protein